MTIEQVIKIMHQDLGAGTYDAYPGLYEAQKLSIEALKRIRLSRQPPYIAPFGPLPGETKEET